MRIERSVMFQDQAIRLLVTKCDQGWQVREEQGSLVLLDVIRDDWHRVERDLRLFEMKASVLREQGWIDGRPTSQRRAA